MENDLLEIADDTDRDYREGKNGQEIPNKRPFACQGYPLSGTYSFGLTPPGPGMVFELV